MVRVGGLVRVLVKKGVLTGVRVRVVVNVRVAVGWVPVPVAVGVAVNAGGQPGRAVVPSARIIQLPGMVEFRSSIMPIVLFQQRLSRYGLEVISLAMNQKRTCAG